MIRIRVDLFPLQGVLSADAASVRLMLLCELASQPPRASKFSRRLHCASIRYHRRPRSGGLRGAGRHLCITPQQRWPFRRPALPVLSPRDLDVDQM
jgi:hypothetical protein